MTTSCYVTRQGWHQTQLLMAAEPIEKVMLSDSVSNSHKEKLKFLQRVLQAAREEGLRVGEAYQDYVDTGQPVASWLVFASAPDRLKSKTWWFPIVGSVPYIGYFDRADRDAFAVQLSEEGYDVYKGSASAFSSLGWIDEPVFSSMLSRRSWALAQLFFHELVHRTLWVQGSVRFNENMAAYVAQHLTEKWLKKWDLREELVDYGLHREDRRRYKVWAHNFREALRKLYQQPEFHLERKRAVFDEWVVKHKPEFQVYDFVGKKPWNNATVQAVSLYESHEQAFFEAHQCFGIDRPVTEFLQALDNAYGAQEGDAQGALAALCHQRRQHAGN